MKYRAIVIGCSAGGIEVCGMILSNLRSDLLLPIVIAQHLGENNFNYPKILGETVQRELIEARDKERINDGKIYTAPSGYHLLIEKDQTFSLSVDPPVCYARPSIDVLFESAADCYSEQLIGILLTGANSDGAEGLAKIAEFGGLTIVQNPDTAPNRLMPLSGMKKVKEAKILDLDNIINTINEVGCG